MCLELWKVANGWMVRPSVGVDVETHVFNTFYGLCEHLRQVYGVHPMNDAVQPRVEVPEKAAL